MFQKYNSREQELSEISNNGVKKFKYTLSETRDGFELINDTASPLCFLEPVIDLIKFTYKKHRYTEIVKNLQEENIIDNEELITKLLNY